MHIRAHEGDRAALRPLFRLADDSEAAIDGYLDSGDVLVALEGDVTLGYVQLIWLDQAAELKSMAVIDERQHEGIGACLVNAAVAHCADHAVGRLTVATAAADVGNLRFYQRLGFRMLSVERDAFGPATGYHDVVIGGIPLRDRVWLDREV